MGWTELSGFSLGVVEEQVPVTVPLPIDLTGVSQFSTTVISGALPPGLALLDENIIGTPIEVAEDTEFKFVIRASLDGQLSDRTFRLTVTGSDEPTWVTALGSLPVGANDAIYIVESYPVNYPLISVDSDLQELAYSIETGTLPPGLTLSSAGVLSGVAELTLSETPDQYNFTVAVTDGVYSVTRDFSILVVNQSFLSADNTLNLINEFPFTTDVSASSIIRWKTAPDLGTSNRGQFISKIIETESTPVVFRLSEMNTDLETEIVTTFPLTENRYGTDLIRIQGIHVVDAGGAVSVDRIVYRIIDVTPDGGTTLLQIATPLESTVVTGMPVKIGTFSELPTGTEFNEVTGELSGAIRYSAARSKTYRFTILATWESDNDTITSERMFRLTVSGLNYGTLVWDTDSDLGTISPDEACSKVITAHLTNSTPEIHYTITGGGLPAALVMSIDGSISGRINKNSLSVNTAGMTVFETDFSLDSNSTKIDRQYTFTVSASTQLGEELGQKTFYFRLNDNVTDASNITIRPYLKPAQREQLRQFLSDRNIFIQGAIFKPTDANFGIQDSLSMLVFAGLPVQEISTLAEAVASTHRPKRYAFGNLGSAIAINEAGVVEYEVVFVEVVDPYELDAIHLPETVTFPFSTSPLTKTVSSTYWWRQHLEGLGLPDENYIPLWQKCVQPSTGVPIGLKNIVPLCYCKPGYATTIIKNINRSGFKFNNIDYYIDRYTVSRVQGYNYPTYIAFDNRNSTI